MKMTKWKDDELKKAIDLIKNGLSYYEISELLNRTKQSVRVKLNKMGYYVIPKNSYTQKKCLSCNETFDSLKSDNRKFCSQSCSVTFNNKKRKNVKTCVNCGDVIENKGKKFCKLECFFEYQQSKQFELIEEGELTLYSRNYKKYLIHKHGEKCMECGWCEVNKHTGRDPIELEHNDGNSENNELSNLKLLCPNCNSLTPTYNGANRGNGRHYRRERYQEGKSF